MPERALSFGLLHPIGTAPVNRGIGGKEPGARRPASPAGSDFGSEQQDEVFQNLLALVLAVAATLVVYLALAVGFQVPPLAGILGRAPDTGLPWSVAVMLSRGLLQPLNFCIFAVGASLLIVRFWTLRREHQAFRHDYIASLAAARACSTSPLSMARLAFFTNVRALLRNRVLCSRSFSFCRLRLIADLIFAKDPPTFFMNECEFYMKHAEMSSEAK